MNNKVVVIGSNHQNPLGVIEAFGRKGIKTYAIILSKLCKSFVLESKYVAQGWICLTDESAIEYMLQNFTDSKNKTVVFACSDDAASLLDRNYNKLKNYFYLPGIPSEGLLTSWMDKVKMNNTAKKLGLSIPKTWNINDVEKAKEIVYPCLTKPNISAGHGKAGFRICYSEDELNDFLKNKKYFPEIQVQKFVEKEFEFQFIGCSLNGGEEIIIPGRTHIKDTIDFNNIVFLKYCRLESSFDNLLLKCHKYVRATGYSGLFSIEFLKGKDDIDYFLEMNFRNDGNAICVTSAGTNLPYIWYLHATEGDYKKEIESSYVNEVYSTPEDSYFLAMLDGKVSFKEWRRNMRKVTSYLTYFKDNRKPFYALMRLQSGTIVKSIIKRILCYFHILKN